MFDGGKVRSVGLISVLVTQQGDEPHQNQQEALLLVYIRESGVLAGRVGLSYPELQRGHAEIDFSPTVFCSFPSLPVGGLIQGWAVCSTSQELPNESLGNTHYHLLEASRSPGIITWA